jgi:arginase
VPRAPVLLPVRARISEQTPRDLAGIDLLAERLGVPVGPALEGRRGPFGVTPWRDDLEASRPLLGCLAAHVGGRIGQRTPIVLGSDCAVGLATLPAVAAARQDAHVLWLDAHSDYDTPETSSYSFLGAMSLAGATSAWESGLGTVAPERVVLCGPRAQAGDFDAAAQAAVEASAVTVLRAAELERAIELVAGAPVYVHLDTDVLDPEDNPLPYGRPHGVRLGALEAGLARLAAHSEVVGLEVTAFHASEDARAAGELADALAACVLAAVSG